jgi:hypothetical protein
MSFEDAHSEVKALVDQFKANEKYFLSNKYQEAEVRKDFIDRFFIALDWDVLHQSQKNPYEQEVKVERGVDVSGAQKRADYSFALPPNFRDPKFFVEAKKPARDLTNKDYYFQTVRYGWHKTTPLVILTDFEEFHILDCRFSPDINTILSRQVKKYHYSDYADNEKFAEIYWLFSREAVVDNSLEKFSEGLPKPKGKAYQKALFAYEKHLTIDDAFLEEIDGIRVTLAKAFKKNDDSLNSEELTEATQRTIDRLVFIRFLEDKLIEPQHYVSTFGEGKSAWGDFIALCSRLDAKYNGIVFKKSFIDSSSFKGPVDSEFHEICQNICHLNSRFLFNEIPIHILGSIYERFLGKVVHATAKRVTVEEKPEVRKAGGVYYTPKYIVDYIVLNTVGKLIENKTPEQVAKLHFADIACGSGSFLIGVLECLLDYHNKYYQEHPSKAKKAGCIYKDGIWVLSIKQKQDILRNNIYGVDIDSQAVEVTQLSLSLKMLEDETTATANEMQVLFHEKILPDLTRNILCGNSLISNDIISGSLFSDTEERLINAFNFKVAFPDIFKAGGFDVILGNPPYVRVDTLSVSQKGFITKNFRSAKGKYDLYYLFVEKAFSLLNSIGRLGYIIPNRFSTSDSGFSLRKYLIEHANYININSVSRIKVFKEASIYPVILILEGKGQGVKELIINESHVKEELYSTINIIKFNTKEINKLPNSIFPLNSNRTIIDLYFRLIETSALSEQVLLIQEGLRIPSTIEVDKGDFHIIKQFQFSRYSPIKTGAFVTENQLRTVISLTSPRWLNCKKPKIIFAEDALKIEGVIDLSGSICQGGVYFATLLTNDQYDLKYLLALFNSKLLSVIYMNLFAGMHMGGGYLRYRTSFLNKLPIIEIDFSKETYKLKHNQIVNLVDHILIAKTQLQSAKTDKDKTFFTRKIAEIDSQIDGLVYELYGLTEEEIAIVENSVQ